MYVMCRDGMMGNMIVDWDSGLEVVATTQYTRSRGRANNDDTRGMEEITKAKKMDTHLNSRLDGVCSPELVSPTLAAYALI